MAAIPFFLVDAFANSPFSGNPAAVCPLEVWLPDPQLQAMTIEHNQSETAFFVRTQDGFELRWFTTANGEVDLCGHATLASAHVIFHHLGFDESAIRFQSRFSGELIVRRDGEWLTLDFPSWIPEPDIILPTVIDGFRGVAPLEAYSKRDYLFVFETEDEIRAIKPDFARLQTLGRWICITAPGKEVDFVSRFFCPGDALEEDPVTGSAHSMLIPFWAKRLGKTVMTAHQLSPRGGELRCQLKGDRVLIGGKARTYLQGHIFLD